jgi:Ca-activated chloride channel homolog
MRFAQPQFLWLLLILGPLLAGFLVWAWRRKQRLIRQFVPQRLLPQLTNRISRPRQQLRLALLGLSALLALLALARPQWGYEWVEVHRQGLDLVVAIDASRSMLAQDLSPDRLTRAKLAALDLARLSRSDRLALVPFAGTAYLQCPLTIDHEAFRQNLEVISPEIMPQGGTSLAQAIRIATETLRDSSQGDKALVLISDGEDHDGDATNAARQAALAGIRIFTVGVGSPEGALLQSADSSGSLQYIKDPQGNAVLSRLNENLLDQIAREADGFYVSLRSPDAVEIVVNNGLAPLSRSDQSARLTRRFHEQFHWPLALAVLFLLIEGFVSERRRTSPAAARALPRSSSMDSRIAAGFAALLLLPAHAVSPAQALQQFEAGAFDEAEASYQELLQQRGPDPRLHYNRGAAAYRRGDFAAAARDFEAATTAPDLTLQQKAYYNLGNALYRWGEQLEEDSQRIAPWNQALEKYKAALQLQPEDPDAEFNLSFVQQQLQAIPPPPPAPSQQDSNDPSEEPNQDTANPSASSESDSSDSNDPQESSSPSSSPLPENPQEPNPLPETQPPDANSPAPQDPSAEPSPTDAETPAGSAPPAETGPMSPDEVNQLLDASKQEERPMIFAPPSSPLRPAKDW